MDSRELRNALGSFVTGVTVVTTRDADGRDYGVTANSFNSVSLDPPLVLWSLAKASSSLPAFADAEAFAIHVLAADQLDLSNRFAQRSADKFTALAFDRGEAGAPLLSDCAARFVCRPAFRYEGGDHVIFVGEVVAFEHRDVAPLAYHGGRYAVATPRGEALSSDAASLTHRIQSCYFHLLTPVREERARRSISLAQHYMLNVLRPHGALSLTAVNDIIGYTGVRIDADDADDLIARGLVERDDAAGDPCFSLTRRGDEAVVAMIGAAAVKEAGLARTLRDEERDLLIGLLDRVIADTADGAHAPVHRHMALLQQLSADLR